MKKSFPYEKVNIALYIKSGFGCSTAHTEMACQINRKRTGARLLDGSEEIGLDDFEYLSFCGDLNF